MAVTFELPAMIEHQLRGEWTDFDAVAKEAALVGLYRQAKLSIISQLPPWASIILPTTSFIVTQSCGVANLKVGFVALCPIYSIGPGCLEP